MQKSLAYSSLFLATLSATASASTFSANGPGGPVPATGSGDGVFPTTLPTSPFLSNVTLTDPVTSVSSVVLHAVTHTWVGDLQVALIDPTGTGYNMMVRPGFTGTGFGNQGDFLSPGQTITFVPSGGAAIPNGANTNISTGTYDQHFGFGGTWTSGTQNIYNVNMNLISGPAGTWTLAIYDWASGDQGSIASWTMNGTDTAGTITNFCEPGVGGVMACVCGNPNGAGSGCANTGSSGAFFAASGAPDLVADATDPGSLTFTGSSMLSGASCIFLQGDLLVAAGVPFGAGVRCTGGNLKRLYVKSISAGSSSAPGFADRSVSNRSADLGDAIPFGATRWYQIYYRDPGQANPGGGCPVNDTFNITAGLEVVWGPPASPGVLICQPGINGIITCPCGNNPSGPGRGCDNSTFSGGATMSDTGMASISGDNVVFTAADMLPSVGCSLRQGNALVVGGTPFGDGVKCWGGLVLNLYTKTTSVSGTVFIPDFLGGDLSVANRSALLGDVIAPGSTRWYQIHYDDTGVSGCFGGGSPFNVSAGRRITWQL